MDKRKIRLGSYNTADQGWTLAAWQLSPAEQKTNFVDKPGGDGSWDLSTALTGGLPRYKDRTLTVRLERSDGDRMSREAAISHMINTLDGMRLDIDLPDDDTRYITGRVHVACEYSDMAHAAVIVTATCEPWRYHNKEFTITRTASSSITSPVQLNNSGRRAVVPTVKVTGVAPSITLQFGELSWALTEGTYQLPDLLLPPLGTIEPTYKGRGTISITYREADL